MNIDTTKRDYALYHVGLKILLKKGEEFLFLNMPTSKRFDFPGGRIDDVEHFTPLTDILAREISEELGPDLKYKLGKPVFAFRRHLERVGWHIFITIYEADYISGEIKLSDEHSDYQWLNPQTHNFQTEEFFNPEEYLAFKNYFANLK